jgi:putative hydroxymethylpyrimidine transport system permease protein
VTALGLIALWQGIVWATGVPGFILPAPAAVAETLWTQMPRILPHAGITALEIVLGLLLGTLLGGLSALVMVAAAPARRWLMPVLVASQALPVFALAPLLTLWLGYGLASKVAMATLIIYFPVTAAFYDGLRRIDPGWLDMAAVMGGGKLAVLRLIRLPAALPAFASGLRVATAVAPIGAVVGEWVGASAGLGYLMLHANGRMQTDLMFAALIVLMILALSLYFLVDRAARAATSWQPESGYA